MCGIVGYIGSKQAAPILLDGLSKLEYRGYDSAGIAVRDGADKVQIVKAKGRLKGLIEKTDDGHAVPGTCGIGHTRWATHGEPSETNAHPHVSDDGNVVGVHNGIIETYQELKVKLLKKGYEFYSSTDTEVAVKLVDYYYKKYEHTPVDAINHAMVRIRGSYALAMMFAEYPDEIYVARKDSPMIIGVSDGNCYVASDVPAILKYTRNVYYIGNMEIGRLADGKAAFYNLDGDEIEKELVEIKWDAEAAEKGGFEHFMMKEIHEQPKAILDTMNSKIKDGRIDLSDVGLSEEDIKGIDQIYIVACGSAYHTGVVTQYVMEDLARVPVRVELASEFRYRNPILNKDLLYTAAMCHDIGKTQELSLFPDNDYTDDGQLLGHIVIGVEMLDDAIREIPDFPKKLASELKHCIVAHHGELEYGSPKKPALAEAMALNCADNADAKMQTLTEIFKAKDTKDWLGYNRLFESNLRKTSI